MININAAPVKFDSAFAIAFTNDQLLPEAELFNDHVFSLYGYRLKKARHDMILPAALPGKNIVLELSDRNLPDSTGAYRMKIYGNEIRIEAIDRAGIFYGLETLKQLLHHATGKEIPALRITDFPRFTWRGMHLDVSRHFFPKAFIKKYIDLLAIHKMNVFHWHLTDDQGWRIEIRKYPRLTEIGAWRSGSMVGPYSDHRIDSVRYGGYYTQDEIREIVRYARERHVTIVPEIEMPGHSLAALAAYPELSCTGGPFEVGREWGVFEDVYCAGNEKTFAFLQDILDEVCELFPGKYIHIGGDECPKERWKTCLRCQQRMKDEKLEDEHRLQSYFIQRIEKYLNHKDRQVIGWDEILEGGLAPNAAVMSWRGTEGGITAARKKHPVVMTPGSHCYFDHYQGTPAYEPLAIGGYTPVQKVYAYEPVPDELTNDERTYVMGAQGNVWTEYILSGEHAEYMALPRMCALAEVLWTPARLKNEKDFMRRLFHHFSYLDRFGVNYSGSVTRSQASIVRIGPGIGIRLTRYPMSQVTQFSVTPTQCLVTLPAQTSDTTIPVPGSAVIRINDLWNNGTRHLLQPQQITLNVNQATGKNIRLQPMPDERYSTRADITLVDGISATLPRQKEQWLAWKGTDVEMLIDLGKKTKLRTITIGMLNDQPNWIYLPSSIVMERSNDNIRFKEIAVIIPPDTAKQTVRLTTRFRKKKSRYLRITVKNPGKIPAGQPGAGQDSWMFFDEITAD